MAMRSLGSTLDSLAPWVAMVVASCLAVSQLIGTGRLHHAHELGEHRRRERHRVVSEWTFVAHSGMVGACEHELVPRGRSLVGPCVRGLLTWSKDLAMKVIVTGAAGSIGSRLCRRLAECGVSVLALDKDRVATAPEVDHRVVDLATAKLGPLFAGADAVVHLGSPFPADAPSTANSAGPLAVAERVFAAAGESGVAHAIILSTAMVYGAWPNNAVPLTEEAPVRPNPDFAFAVYHAELERRAFEWRAEQCERDAGRVAAGASRRRRTAESFGAAVAIGRDGAHRRRRRAGAVPARR